MEMIIYNYMVCIFLVLLLLYGNENVLVCVLNLWVGW